MDNYCNKTNNINIKNTKSNINENNAFISEISSKINDILDKYNSNINIGSIDTINNVVTNSAINNNAIINNNNYGCDIETRDIDSNNNHNNHNNSNNSCNIELSSSEITKAFEINEIKEFSFLNTSYCRGNIRIYNINNNNNNGLKEILSNIENELASIFSNYGEFEVKLEYYCPCCILPYYRIKFSVDISNL